MKSYGHITLTFLLVFFGVQYAHSETLQFEDAYLPNPIPMGAKTPYEHAGFLVTAPFLSLFMSPEGVSDLGSPASVYGPASSSVFLAFCACAGSVGINRTDSQLFTLNSLDVGVGGGGPGSMHLSGVKNDGSTVNYDFVIDDGAWHTVSFTDNLYFSNLKSLSISGGASFISLAIDNVSLSQVPIPAAAWLFGTGLIGISGLARKCKAV